MDPLTETLVNRSISGSRNGWRGSRGKRPAYPAPPQIAKPFTPPPPFKSPGGFMPPPQAAVGGGSGSVGGGGFMAPPPMPYLPPPPEMQKPWMAPDLGYKDAMYREPQAPPQMIDPDLQAKWDARQAAGDIQTGSKKLGVDPMATRPGFDKGFAPSFPPAIAGGNFINGLMNKKPIPPDLYQTQVTPDKFKY